MATENKFSPWDYVVFSLVLALSAAIGLFYGCTGGKQKTTKEFLMADRKMNFFPVALSLLASFMSAITLLGNPAEIYIYGTQYWMICIGYALMIPLAAHLFIPIFFRLQLTSVFEYLELRFCKGVRLCGAIAYIIQMVLYMSIVLYAPSLALNAVTGLNVWISVFSIRVVCTFYTTLGGMKAVLWTDVFQICMMFAGLIAVLIRGSMDFDGFGNIWKIVDEGERIEFFNLDPNPLTRHSFWTLSIGGCFTWLAIYGVNQAQAQRALCCPDLKSAQTALWINVPGLTALVTVCSLCGMVIYAQYRDCDPIKNKDIDKSDQLLPLYVMDNLGHITGLPGLFTASLFSGALSTISSGLNSLSAVTLTDIVRQYFFKDMTESRATTVSKILAIAYGVVCIALTFVAAELGSILQAALAIFGMVGGPQLGLFMLGILYPCANNKGAYAGFLVGLATTMWLGIGAQVYKPFTWKPPVSTAGCNTTRSENMTTTTIMTTTAQAAADKAGYFDFYAISYLYYAVFAVLVVKVVGLIVSFATGANKPGDVNPELIAPFFDVFCCCLPEKLRKCLRCGVNYDEDEEEKKDDVYHSKNVLRGSYGMDLEEYRKNYQRRKMSELKYVQRKNSEDMLDFKGNLESYPEEEYSEEEEEPPPEYPGGPKNEPSRQSYGEPYREPFGEPPREPATESSGESLEELPREPPEEYYEEPPEELPREPPGELSGEPPREPPEEYYGEPPKEPAGGPSGELAGELPRETFREPPERPSEEPFGEHSEETPQESYGTPPDEPTTETFGEPPREPATESSGEDFGEPPEYNGRDRIIEVGRNMDEFGCYHNPAYRHSIVMILDGVETEVTHL